MARHSRKDTERTGATGLASASARAWTKSRRAARPAAEAESGVRILVVDDNADSRRVHSDFEDDYEVVAVATGDLIASSTNGDVVAAPSQTRLSPLVNLVLPAGSRYLARMGRRGAVWFRRFADVPGIGYQGDLARRSRLPDRDLVPEVSEFEFEGRKTVSLMWKTRRGTSSASPAHEHGFHDVSGESSARIREHVLDALELPGEPMDYHFAMQHAAEALYKRRRREPSFLPFVEWLAWNDARLVEAQETIFRIGDAGDEYVSIFALGFLIDFHEREGFLHEALALAERFAKFRPHRDLTELRGRVALLRTEHG